MLLLLAGMATAQHASLMGFSGLIVTPSADLAPDGQLSLGVSRIPELYADKLRPYQRTVYFARLGYLPFLEGTAMIVRPDDYPGGVGDRSLHVKFQLLHEKGHRPGMAIGAQDFFAARGLDFEPARAQHFAALYVVASKNLSLQPVPVRWHLGFGADWLPAKNRFLDGLFAGVTLTPHRYLIFLAEYDAHAFNAGFRLHPVSWVQAQLAWWKLQQWTATLVLSASFK